MLEMCGTGKEGHFKRKGKKGKADNYNLIAPDLHKQPFEDEHQLTFLRGFQLSAVVNRAPFFRNMLCVAA